LLRSPLKAGLPDVLTPATIAVCVWRAFDDVAAAVVCAAFVSTAYVVWMSRRRRWHDWGTIALLLPALAAALVAESIALTGLVCALVGYQGRHRP
jgi:hypothetical protein